MLALSLPNGFASKSYGSMKSIITRGTAPLGCAPFIHRQPLLRASRPGTLVVSSLDSLTSRSKFFRIRTYERLSYNHCRMNTYEPGDLKSPVMNTYRKTEGWGVEPKSPARSARAAKKVGARAVTHLLPSCTSALLPSLFCAVQDVNPSAFKHRRTLWRKTPGVRVPRFG